MAQPPPRYHATYGYRLFVRGSPSQRARLLETRSMHLGWDGESVVAAAMHIACATMGSPPLPPPPPPPRQVRPAYCSTTPAQLLTGVMSWKPYTSEVPHHP